MSALYVLRLADRPGCCVGAVYLGRGVVVGVDVAGIRYSGTCERLPEGIRFHVIAGAPASGAILASGRFFPPGEDTTITGLIPNDFETGASFDVRLLGASVTVSLDKIGDVP